MRITTDLFRVIPSRDPDPSLARPTYRRDETSQRQFMIGAVMKRSELETLSVDDLWKLYEEVAETLAAKLTAKKNVLDERLDQLSRPSLDAVYHGKGGGGSHPKALPKFQNPDEPSQTWTGRGKQPKWLAAQLRSGKRLEDFRIKR